MNAVKISIDERNRGDTILRAEQNYAIDVVKYIMEFCVIAIHTLPLKNVQNEVVTSFFDTFVSLAVPFFFLSSGYLVEKNAKKE